MFKRVVSFPFRALKWLAFGSVQFSEQEEYLEFRYKFLIVLMLTATALTGLFILGLISQINLIGWAHGRMMITYVTGTVLLWLLLRGSPQRFKTIGWTYEVLSLLEDGSALAYVPIDELRVLWFYTNIPCVFILLGQRAGWGVTGLTMAVFLMGNEYVLAQCDGDGYFGYGVSGRVVPCLCGSLDVLLQTHARLQRTVA